MMTGAFAGRNVGELFPVVSAVAKEIGQDGVAYYAAYVHEALFDSNPAQKESLLSVHQSLRDRRNGIDDRARCERDLHGNPGLQAARFDDKVVPFYFDGTKCFFAVYHLSEEEECSLSKIVLTDGSVPYYDPTARLHSRRRPTSSPDLTTWKHNLGFIPDHVVAKTLSVTTQLVPTVEAETREIMRDHFQTHLVPELRVRRVNDACYVDTFFSSIPSVRGFTCWNLFCFQRTGLDVVYLMRRRSQSPTTLPRMVAECGAPLTLKSDNAPEFKGKHWVDYLNSMSIQSVFTEAHHPNENLAERRGGSLKAATVHLLRLTGCPLSYWCFALEYVCLVRTVLLAQRSLGWLTPHEVHWGDRPDISMFRFVFWQPVWYYQPRQSFPRTKMLKGRFLGIAQNVGDAFCFLILTQPGNADDSPPQVLARSVIRKRYPREDPPVVDTSSAPAPLLFYKSDGITPLDDPTSVPESEGVDIYSDVMSDRPSSLQPTFRSVSSQSNGEVEDSDAFDDGILEVYGPPTTRPRLSDVGSDLSSSVSTDSVLQPPMHDSEEQPVLLADNIALHPTDVRPSHLLISQSDPVLPSVSFEGHSTIPATVPTVDSPNYGLVDDRLTSPIGLGSSGDFRQITQDKDAEPHVLDDVAHQLSRVTADSTTSGRMLKLDYPRETADYVLKHKLGCADGRYLGRRYTRWARQFTRQYTKVVRRLLRGYHYRGDAATPASIRVAERLPDGTRLIRRVTREDSKPPGVSRKRKKPGRLSRPVEIKYGVPVPRNVRHALELDREAGNTFWADAIRKEIASLLALDCFEFHDPGYKPSSEFQ